jgi:predicted extracellular nuclease
VDGLGPDGNQDIQNPQNDATCDLDGDGILDGNRLFSRPPLVAEIRVCAGACLAPPGVPPAPSLVLTLIVNHFKSKTQDTEWNQYTLPRRVEQASFVASLVEEIQETDPGVHLAVIGDLNDYPDSAPVAQLESAGLAGVTNWLPPSERYTYIYQGVSQVLDYVLVNRMLLDERIEPQVIHINVDFPEILGNTVETILRSSDHDPLVVDFTMMPYKLWLPFGSRQNL